MGDSLDYPIVEIETQDKIVLYGLISESRDADTILINMHGTASNFYENYFMVPLTKALLKRGISVLSPNNRGAAVMQVYPPCGAALEHFEDCIKDIDAWIRFALSKGYKKVILQGHSLGAEKAVYYAAKGRYRNAIAALVLLGPADSYGYNYSLLGPKKMKMLFKEARSLVAEGKGEQFLTSTWLSHGGVLPKGAESFLNFFSEGSEASKALPLHEPKGMALFAKIGIPVFVAIGNRHEYTVIPIKRALDALSAANKNAECRQLRGCDHDFSGKEAELTKLILAFLQRNSIL